MKLGVVALRRTLAVVCVASTVAIPTPAPAASTHGHRHSQIVWTQFNEDFTAARLMIGGPAGKDVRPLTAWVDGVVDLDAQISPDGRSVLFGRETADDVQIVLVSTRGGHQRVLDFGCVDPCAVDIAPTWTPDGRHVVFNRVVGPFDEATGDAESASLWVGNIKTGSAHRISPMGIDGHYEEVGASFAPSGYMVFLRLRLENSARGFGSAVFRRDPNGRTRQLTPWRLDADIASVSLATSGPTKDLVVFETYGHGLNQPGDAAQAVGTVPATCHPVADCARQVRLLTDRSFDTDYPVENYNPAWSPDGRRIAFVRAFEGTATEPSNADIWTMRWNGTAKHRVTRSPLWDFRPDWGIAPHDSLR